MQEEHISKGNEQGCLLIFETGSWWICIPGWGKQPTQWLAEGMVQAGVGPMDLEQISWKAPWNQKTPTKALACQQGALWLYDRLNAEKDKDC